MGKHSQNTKLEDQIRAAKTEFDSAHADGIECLRARDFAGLHRAIQRERDATMKFTKAVDRRMSLNENSRRPRAPKRRP